MDHVPYETQLIPRIGYTIIMRQCLPYALAHSVNLNQGCVDGMSAAFPVIQDFSGGPGGSGSRRGRIYTLVIVHVPASSAIVATIALVETTEVEVVICAFKRIFHRSDVAMNG